MGKYVGCCKKEQRMSENNNPNEIQIKEKFYRFANMAMRLF
jgi:hypothetical protein